MRRALFLPLVLLACSDGGSGLSAVSSPLTEEGPQVAQTSQESLGPLSDSEYRDIVEKVLDRLDKRDVDGARNVCLEALEARPGEPAILRVLATVEMVGQNYESTVDIATAQLKRDPGAVPFLGLRADAYFKLQEIEKSRQDINAIIERLESAVGKREGVCGVSTEAAIREARVDLARTYYMVGDYDKAEAITNDVLAQDPESQSARFMLALVRNKRDDIAGSESLYKGLLKEDPRCAACWNNLGVLAYRRHDLEASKKYLERALRLTPDWNLYDTALVLSNLAELDLLKGRFREAEARYREAIQTAWRYPGSYYGLALLQDIKGFRTEAKATLTQALLWDPQGLERNHAEYYEPEWRWYLEGMVAEHQGILDLAKEYFEKVADGKVRMLRAPARRHLSELAY